MKNDWWGKWWINSKEDKEREQITMKKKTRKMTKQSLHTAYNIISVMEKHDHKASNENDTYTNNNESLYKHHVTYLQ